jgi:hypothetical protein
MDKSDTLLGSCVPWQAIKPNCANFWSTYFDLIAYNMTAVIALRGLDLRSYPPNGEWLPDRQTGHFGLAASELLLYGVTRFGCQAGNRIDESRELQKNQRLNTN